MNAQIQWGKEECVKFLDEGEMAKKSGKVCVWIYRDEEKLDMFKRERTY